VTAARPSQQQRRRQRQHQPTPRWRSAQGARACTWQSGEVQRGQRDSITVSVVKAAEPLSQLHPARRGRRTPTLYISDFISSFCLISSWNMSSNTRRAYARTDSGEWSVGRTIWSAQHTRNS
jgi:hypothetical protein